jgi:ribosomal protein L19E
MAIKREKAFEFTIEWSSDIEKVDKKYRQLRDDGKTDIRTYISYYLESVERINEDDDSLSDEDEIAIT